METERAVQDARPYNTQHDPGRGRCDRRLPVVFRRQLNKTEMLSRRAIRRNDRNTSGASVTGASAMVIHSESTGSLSLPRTLTR